MDRRSFAPPSKAPAHGALLSAAEDAGKNVTALRDLLWLLNAHPELIGHAQIFRNIHLFLTCSIFERDSVTWAREWIQNKEQWIELCQWIWDMRVTLSQRPGLSELQRDKKDSHPILGEGISRHPIPAALWNEWDTASWKKSHDPKNVEINSFQRLQAHLFAASVDARFRLSTRADYESHAASHEFPVAPARAAPVGIAMREFSIFKHESVVSSLPHIDNTVEFASALLSHTIPFTHLNSTDKDWTLAYFDRLKRFFKRFLDVREGFRPRQTLRSGWHGGGGGGKRHPGFINMENATDLVIEAPPPQEEDPDPDIPKKTIGKTICSSPFSSSEEKKTSSKKRALNARELEESGLSPNELLDEIVTLVSPEVLRKNLQTLRNQRALLEMQAQNLPFDFANLTDMEIVCVWKTANQALLQFCESPEKNDKLRNVALAGVLLKLSIAYGQPIEKLTCCSWFYSDSTIHLPPSISLQKLPAILFTHSDEEPSWKFAGLIQPPLTPDYLTRLPEELEEVDPCVLSPFVLPDHLKIAKDFYCLNDQTPRHGEAVFDSDPNELRSAAFQLIDKCNDQLYFSKTYDIGVKEKEQNDKKPKQKKRITPQKIAQTLRAKIIFIEGDQTLADITTNNLSAANEPRLFYSRASANRTLLVYRRAARHIGKIVGIRIPAKDIKPASEIDDHNFSGGARFVLAKVELKKLTHILKTELIAKDVDHNSFDDVAAYHNNYVLYSLLYQSLSSTLRAIRNLGDIYKTWQRQRSNRRILCGIKDKGSSYHDKVRLIVIPEGLAKQFKLLEQHDNYLAKQPKLEIMLSHPSIRDSAPFYFISQDHLVVPATPSSIGEVLEHFSEFPIPPNFQRSLIRTDLLENYCPTEVIDALLGHANLGESPFGKYSTFDYSAFIDIVETHISRLHEELDLTPIASRAIPFSVRRPKK